MARKRWTAQTEITDALLRVREKRKWQLGYRRYVVEQKPSETYAPYFGLDIITLRSWFEIQFTEGLNWENYGKAWQFEHIVPATWFNFADEEELKLCWSYINMRVQLVDPADSKGVHTDLLQARAYFLNLYQHTGLGRCQQMLDKITSIEKAGVARTPAIEAFLLKHQTKLEQVHSLDAQGLHQLNKGMTLEEILLEREILRKFS